MQEIAGRQGEKTPGNAAENGVLPTCTHNPIELRGLRHRHDFWGEAASPGEVKAHDLTLCIAGRQPATIDRWSALAARTRGLSLLPPPNFPRDPVIYGRFLPQRVALDGTVPDGLWDSGQRQKSGCGPFLVPQPCCAGTLGATGSLPASAGTRVDKPPVAPVI